jgi:hypothetical protein
VNKPGLCNSCWKTQNANDTDWSASWKWILGFAACIALVGYGMKKLNEEAVDFHSHLNRKLAARSNHPNGSGVYAAAQEKALEHRRIQDEQYRNAKRFVLQEEEQGSMENRSRSDVAAQHGPSGSDKADPNAATVQRLQEIDSQMASTKEEWDQCGKQLRDLEDFQKNSLRSYKPDSADIEVQRTWLVQNDAREKQIADLKVRCQSLGNRYHQLEDEESKITSETGVDIVHRG